MTTEMKIAAVIASLAAVRFLAGCAALFSFDRHKKYALRQLRFNKPRGLPRALAKAVEEERPNEADFAHANPRAKFHREPYEVALRRCEAFGISRFRRWLVS